MNGAPPANDAVIPPMSTSSQRKTGIEGSTLRGMRAIRMATAISSATNAIGTQPG